MEESTEKKRGSIMNLIPASISDKYDKGAVIIMDSVLY